MAAFYNSVSGVSKLPVEFVSNMFHIHFKYPKNRIAPILACVHEMVSVSLASYFTNIGEEKGWAFEVSFGDFYETVLKEKIIKAFKLLDVKMKQV